MSQNTLLLAAICTILTFVLTLLIGVRRVRADMIREIKNDLIVEGHFVTSKEYKQQNNDTCNRLDDISKDIKQGTKEFLIIRLLLLEANIVPEEKAEEIRNAVMNGRD